MAEATDRVLAIDIGGTKMAVGIVSDTGVLEHRASVPTPQGANAIELFDTLAALVVPLLDYGPLVACGVGCGGPMSAGGETVSPLNIGGWRNFPLRSRLGALTGFDTFVDNDAKALALAEGWVGAAQGERNYLAMVVSTGIGAGIVVDGRLLDGATGNAGHIGHVVVEPDGYALPGHVPGVLEAEASGTAIAAWSGRPPAQANPDDVNHVATMVGRAVGSVANLLDLRLALVAGSVALGYGQPFFDTAQAEVDRICQLDFSRGAKILPAGCGDAGPLLGAGAVGLRGRGRLSVGCS